MNYVFADFILMPQEQYAVLVVNHRKKRIMSQHVLGKFTRSCYSFCFKYLILAFGHFKYIQEVTSILID